MCLLFRYKSLILQITKLQCSSLHQLLWAFVVSKCGIRLPNEELFLSMFTISIFIIRIVLFSYVLPTCMNVQSSSLRGRISHTRAHLRMNWVGRQIDVSSLGTITVSKSTSIRTCETSLSFLMNSWSNFLWSTSIFIHSLYDYIYVLVLTDIYTRVHVWIISMDRIVCVFTFCSIFEVIIRAALHPLSNLLFV